MDAEENQAGGSTVYSDYIADQLTRQDRRRASIESRGLAVVTTAGALATLLLGLAALTNKGTSKSRFELPDASQGWLKWALVFFTVAALGAIVTNSPVKVLWADTEGLKKLLTDSWSDTSPEAEKTVSENRIELLENMIRWSNVKGWALVAAMVAEVIAIGCIARAVWLAL